MSNLKQPHESMLRNYDNEVIKLDYWIDYNKYSSCPSCGKIINLQRINCFEKRCPHCAQPLICESHIT